MAIKQFSKLGHLSSIRCMRFSTTTVRASTRNAPIKPLPSEPYARLSRLWLATGGITATENEDAHAKLIRAGYLRQSHAGIFHMLPLGQRVQEKLERLIDKYMLQLGASKVSLSSISSQALWHQTDRLEGYGPELFRFADRKDIQYLLAPTHEEEITTLVSKTVKSYKGLPLRLYQIGRKYRDEIRPRHGLLRSREFLMKDLYTFDYSIKTALSSYEQVRSAYSRLFDELKLPYLVAEASSGDIGGDLSHEYHLPASTGEDNVISCSDCSYVANEEVATSARPLEGIDKDAPVLDEETIGKEIPNVWRGVTKDRKTLVNVWFPPKFSTTDVNLDAVKLVVSELDTSLEQPLAFWGPAVASASSSAYEGPLRVLNVVDYRLEGTKAWILDNSPLARSAQLPLAECDLSAVKGDITMAVESDVVVPSDGEMPNVLRIRDGDRCPRCKTGKLKVQKAIELGHTFHLGTRYSGPLKAQVQVPSNLLEEQPAGAKKDSLTSVPMQMGCHGIGVSRIIGAVADRLGDERGLNWPRAIAPYEVIVIPGRKAEEEASRVAAHLTETLLSTSPIDLVLDDRSESFSWKMNDADLVGYPVIVVLGKKWASDGLCEVQCRRLSIKDHVPFDDLPAYVANLLSQV